ncbi:Hypothetical predicted protein [Pelobates cultripes]|uniref:Uncharacterized protein n=1 Tax=Pelobates cultripes TaxID=61616 RepID=A0AAD1WRN2_PELCU|nr:Hypothetical predicted protein [Pelobates cultripes]
MRPRVEMGSLRSSMIRCHSDLSFPDDTQYGDEQPVDRLHCSSKHEPSSGVLIVMVTPFLDTNKQVGNHNR